MQAYNELKADPANKDKSREELMSMASRAVYGSQYARTDATMENNIAVRKEKDPALHMLNIQMMGAKTPDQQAKIQAQIDARERKIESDMRQGSSGSISSALPQSGQQTGGTMSSKGFKVLGTE
jgi:transposase